MNHVTVGFFKQAMASGLTFDNALDCVKLAFNDEPLTSSDVASYKALMRDDMGMPTDYLAAQDSPYAKMQAAQFLAKRDQLLTQSPEAQPYISALAEGGMGAVAGGVGGHVLGEIASHVVRPGLVSPATLKAVGHYGGGALGAIGGAAHAALETKRNQDLARKLLDNRNADAMLRTLSAERGLVRGS